MAFRIVFVTVGTTKFDEFVSTITKNKILNVLKERGCEKLILQIGNGAIEPKKLPNSSEAPSVDWYRFKKDLREDIEAADVVISHAGAGSCLEALEAGKKLLVVVNEKLMDNHQMELAHKLQEEGYLQYTTCSKLSETLKNVDPQSLKPYPKSDTKVFGRFIDQVMGFNEEN